METNADLSRWRDAPRGLAYRRWVMIATGLRQLWQTRFFRILLIVAWSSGGFIAAAGFAFSQSVSTGGWLETLAVRLGPRAEAITAILSGFVALFPDVVIRGVFTLLFWMHSYVGLWLSLLALTVLTPQLITRDRASHALIVYLSRPLTTLDYLLGKLGIIAGVLFLVWTGPLLFGWALSMLFATDRDFVVYSFAPLLRGLAFNAIALVVLAAISLGVSAASRSSRTTVIIWVGLWAILGFITSSRTPNWLNRTSFTHSLGQVRQEILQLDRAMTDAAVNLPVVNERFAADLARLGKNSAPTDFHGALVSLAVLTALSSLVFFRKLRAE